MMTTESGFRTLADGFREIPAKIDLDIGFHRLLARHGEELLLRELHRTLAETLSSSGYGITCAT